MQRVKKSPRQVTWSRCILQVAACLVLTLALTCRSAAQTPAEDSTQSKKIRNYALVAGAAYGVALYGLNQAWYADFPRSNFHFFNDNNQWKQLDKFGHFYSAFHLSRSGIHLLKRANLEAKKAHLWGGLVGIFILTPIEILDGFSEEYGASWGDVIANNAGSALALGQHLVWDQVRIKPKFSFSATPFAEIRPEVLGDGFHEEFLKDYNGQTYWLSIDIHAFQRPETKFPKWLNLALGYGANNLVFANHQQNLSQGFDAHRQYYLGLDIDLSHFYSGNKLTNTLLYLVDLIHLPAPTLEYNRIEGFKFHLVKF